MEGTKVGQLDEAGAGVVALVAQDAVQLQRMADTLVDLQHHLVRRQHQGAGVGRAGRGAQELHRLAADHGGLSQHARKIQQFAAALVGQRPRTIGGAALHDIPVAGHRVQGQRVEVQSLLDARAGSADQLVVIAPLSHRSHGLNHLVADLQSLAGLNQVGADNVGAQRRLQPARALVVRCCSRPHRLVKAKHAPAHHGLGGSQSGHRGPGHP